MTPYKTFAEKDSRFESHHLQTFAEVQSRLIALKNDGYYFRGQREASWKLVSAAQREWLGKNLQSRFCTIHDFIQSHVDYQRSQANAQFTAQCSQLNDISVLSTMQHFGGPTPFLDFTTNTEAALFFATDWLQAAGSDEITKWVSIYAWKPGDGAATASTNDLFNWEKIIDLYGGLDAAKEYKTLKGLSTLFIRQNTGIFLQITNSRLQRQGGLFLYSSAALNASKPYEELFEGMTAAKVVGHYEGLFLPKMVCLNFPKSLVPEVATHLQGQRITKVSLGLDTPHWSEDVYKGFLKTL
jgi:hypothetical protein